MRKIFQRSTLTGIVSIALLVILSSFLLRRGGDSYTISLNGKQVIQHHVLSKEAVPSLTIQSNKEDQLSVYYSECGKIGTSRALTLRDGQNTVLKEWKFVNSTTEHAPMTVNTADINHTGNIGLFYSSKEVTNPRKLVSLIVSNATATSRSK